MHILLLKIKKKSKKNLHIGQHTKVNLVYGKKE